MSNTKFEGRYRNYAVQGIPRTQATKMALRDVSAAANAASGDWFSRRSKELQAMGKSLSEAVAQTHAEARGVVADDGATEAEVQLRAEKYVRDSGGDIKFADARTWALKDIAKDRAAGRRLREPAEVTLMRQSMADDFRAKGATRSDAEARALRELPLPAGSSRGWVQAERVDSTPAAPVDARAAHLAALIRKLQDADPKL